MPYFTDKTDNDFRRYAVPYYARNVDGFHIS